jgi:NifU-like protein involved in Fe-S cluster formation
MTAETIHFYATNPQHMGEIDHPSVRYIEKNSVCGDDIEVFLCIQGTTITEWSFTGKASMITIACSGLF